MASLKKTHLCKHSSHLVRQ